jgi:asparagine synthase (glutamine-hydrolysing)
MLDDLLGMVALVVWDRRRRRLLLARDRFGIKPLFYAEVGNRLLFASEVKALLTHPDCPRQFDWDAALADPWLAQDPAATWSRPRSYFRGIEHLPGGCLVDARLRPRRVEQRPYWTPPLGQPPAPADHRRGDRRWIAAYGELLRDSVRRCLMADVEIGVFLSGGIDSIAVAALAARHARLHTFTVLGRSTLHNGDAEHAHRAAARLGLPNHQVIFDWQETPFQPDHWKQLLWLCETPYTGPEQLYKFHLHRYARSVRPGLKVILTGQGSDEFNGGYSTLFAGGGRPSWSSFLGGLAALERGGLVREGSPHLRAWQDRFDTELFDRRFLRARASAPAFDDPWLNYQATKLHDLQVYNLWHEDRTAAGNAIEGRVPFLDHRLVELVMRIPADRRAALLWDKRILRSALVGAVPPALCRRPKVPFFHGPDLRDTNRMMLRLLGARRGALIEEAFCTGGEAERVLRPGALRSILREATGDPESVNADLVLRLVNMGLLDRMARSMDVSAVPGDDVPVLEAAEIRSWREDAARLAIRLSGRRALAADSVLSIPSRVALVHSDRDGAARESYVLVDGRLEFVLDEESGPWLRVLRRLDGKRTFRKALSLARVQEAEVRRHAEEALEFGVLELVTPPRRAGRPDLSEV